MEWASEHPQVKVTKAPVLCDLPDEYKSALLADVRISCSGPDDKAYDQSPKLRRKVRKFSLLIVLVVFHYSYIRLTVFIAV